MLLVTLIDNKIKKEIFVVETDRKVDLLEQLTETFMAEKILPDVSVFKDDGGKEVPILLIEMDSGLCDDTLGKWGWLPQSASDG